MGVEGSDIWANMNGGCNRNKGLCWWVGRAVFIFLVTAPSWLIIIAYGCCHLTACVCFSSFASTLSLLSLPMHQSLLQLSWQLELESFDLWYLFLAAKHCCQTLHSWYAVQMPSVVVYSASAGLFHEYTVTGSSFSWLRCHCDSYLCCVYTTVSRHAWVLFLQFLAIITDVGHTPMYDKVCVG